MPTLGRTHYLDVDDDDVDHTLYDTEGRGLPLRGRGVWGSAYRGLFGRALEEPLEGPHPDPGPDPDMGQDAYDAPPVPEQEPEEEDYDMDYSTYDAPPMLEEEAQGEPDDAGMDYDVYDAPPLPSEQGEGDGEEDDGYEDNAPAEEGYEQEDDGMPLPEEEASEENPDNDFIQQVQECLKSDYGLDESPEEIEEALRLHPEFLDVLEDQGEDDGQAPQDEQQEGEEDAGEIEQAPPEEDEEGEEEYMYPPVAEDEGDLQEQEQQDEQEEQAEDEEQQLQEDLEASPDPEDEGQLEEAEPAAEPEPEPEQEPEPEPEAAVAEAVPEPEPQPQAQEGLSADQSQLLDALEEAVQACATDGDRKALVQALGGPALPSLAGLSSSDKNAATRNAVAEAADALILSGIPMDGLVAALQAGAGAKDGVESKGGRLRLAGAKRRR